MHFFLVYSSISGVKIHAANKANKVHAFKDHQHDSRTMPFCFLPASIYLFKVNNSNTRKRCEICSKFNIKNTRTTTSDVVRKTLQDLMYNIVKYEKVNQQR